MQINIDLNLIELIQCRRIDQFLCLVWIINLELVKI